VRAPLVPVTVTVYVPAEPEQDNVEEPEPPDRLVGVRVHARPVAGDTEVVSVTVPVKPPMELTVIVEVPVAPALTPTLLGLAASPKSADTPFQR